MIFCGLILGFLICFWVEQRFSAASKNYSDAASGAEASRKPVFCMQA
jgi:hypothetical protein